MSFLGMGTMEIIIILLVAFIFLGPERMVDAARTLGKWSGELRRMSSTVQAEMDDIVNVDTQPRSQRPGAPSKPLDQERAVANPDSEPHPESADGPVAFRRAATNPVQPSPDEAQVSRGEERA